MVVVLSDWTFENPHDVLANLKKRANYYNFQRNTVADAVRGEGMSVEDRLMWQQMRMDPSDIMDITGATYTYLMNGKRPTPAGTASSGPASASASGSSTPAAARSTTSAIPGLDLSVVQVNGQHVQPVTVEEFRMGIAETYDIVVTPGDRAYTLFAESMDRSGYARGTLAPRPGMTAPVPEMRDRPTLTMMDMGMDHGGMEGMDHGSMAGMDHGSMAGMDHGASGHGGTAAAGGAMAGMDHGSMDHGQTDPSGMATGAASGDMAMPGMDRSGLRPPGTLPEPTMHGPDSHGIANAMAPMQTQSRLHEPGVGLGEDGRRVLVYADLKALHPEPRRAPDREVELHLTGNMERYMWGINGKTYSEDPLIPMVYGERLRLTMVNDTMMNHPMHLHGMWMELENGQGDYIPRVHTVVVKPAERLSLLIDVDALGPWAFHCHILYHMDLGMFRVAMVQRPDDWDPEVLASLYPDGPPRRDLARG